MQITSLHSLNAFLLPIKTVGVQVMKTFFVSLCNATSHCIDSYFLGEVCLCHFLFWLFVSKL